MGRSEHSHKRKDVEKRLRADGWRIARKGPGDHVQYTHPDRPGRVTVDTGSSDIPTGTLRSIYKQAGWTW
jgi:predicted RNA binding protein YcfA (HicA-like mRNA interferase family)